MTIKKIVHTRYDFIYYSFITYLDYKTADIVLEPKFKFV